MLNEIQVLNGQNNCVIVSGGYTQSQTKMMDNKRAIPIAPAPIKANNLSNTSDLMKCRKKMNYKQGSYPTYQTASIIRRNARERNRVKQVNDGFAALRKHLPPDVVATLSNNRRGTSKKLSKVDTLKMVVEYIRYLQQLLDENEDGLEDKNENQENHIYYTQSPMSMEASQRLEQGYILDHTPPSSETSSSPAPSFSSEVSTGISGYTLNGYYPIDKYENQPINPMDEELLDVISWWQQK